MATASSDRSSGSMIPSPRSLTRLALAAMLAQRGHRPATVPATARAAASAAEETPLVTERMTIRALRKSDCVEFLRVLRLNREHLARFFPLSRAGEPDLEIFARELRLAEVSGRTGDWRRAAFAPDGRMVGCFNLNAISRGLVFRAESTLWISAEFAGRGLAAEGFRAVLDHAFADPAVMQRRPGSGTGNGGLGLHRVDGFISPDNTSCIQLVRKLGFRPQEPRVRVPLTVAGKPKEHELYTLWAPVTGLPVLEFKLLPAHLRRLVGPQLAALELAEPAEECGAVGM